MKNISYFRSLVKILVVATALLVSYKFNAFLFDGTRFQIYPGANLIFIPSFIKLLSVLVFGWYGMIGTMLGTIFLVDHTSTLEIMIINILLFGCAPMISLLVTNKICQLSDALVNLKYYHIIILSGIASSFGLLNGIMIYDNIDTGLCMMIGDFTTDMILLFSLSMTLRGWEFFTKSKKIYNINGERKC